MGRITGLLLTVLQATSISATLSNPPGFESNRSTSWDSPYSRAENPVDPLDLSFITKIAAIGDSYSAGIGAGSRLGTLLQAADRKSDWSCSRYDSSYPYLVNEDYRLGPKNKRTFQFKSCSGALIDEVIEDQLPDVDSGQQVILLSAGGNDAELVNLLNQCIYQWAIITKAQAILMEAVTTFIKEVKWAKDVPWDVLSRGCNTQIDTSVGIINSDAFNEKLDKLIQATQKKLAKDGIIYVTGYAKFFDEELTPDCDKISWSTWIFKIFNPFLRTKAMLDVSHRRALNDLVHITNQGIANAVQKAGSNVKYIDYDMDVGEYGGRFCEPGVDESTKESNARPDLMFYKLDFVDPIGNTPAKREDIDKPYNFTFAGQLAIFAKVTMRADPGAKLRLTGEVPGSPNEKFELDADDDGTGQDDLKKAYPIENPLPDGYGRVFHPQMSLHQLTANRIIYDLIAKRAKDLKLPEIPEQFNKSSCSVRPYLGSNPLHYLNFTEPGDAIKSGTELRILSVGDSITAGYLSKDDAADGIGYREQLKKDLSQDNVTFVGTEHKGKMEGNHFAAWRDGVEYVTDHIIPSLWERPNIILLYVGTDDLNVAEPNPNMTASLTGALIKRLEKKCPDATILVAINIDRCEGSNDATRTYQSLVSQVVKLWRHVGKQVLPVDFRTFSTKGLASCIWPSKAGYGEMGHYWYDMISQIPKDWIQEPVGMDPPVDKSTSDDNGGLDTSLGPPVLPKNPIRGSDPDRTESAAKQVKGNTGWNCPSWPQWKDAGLISGNYGNEGVWHFNSSWEKDHTEVGHNMDKLKERFFRFHDMDGDGRADMIWIDPASGAIWCWLNDLPNGWYTKGKKLGVIMPGIAVEEENFLADMDGDGKADILLMNPYTGSIGVWWNNGPDWRSENGWRFEPGDEIFTGVRHANLDTIRFPDINGDGRADYLYVGKRGSMRLFLNTPGNSSREVVFEDQHSISSGEMNDVNINVNNIVFADMNGDGRDDFLVWDDRGGLTGFLNRYRFSQGYPDWVAQGPKKSLFVGLEGVRPTSLRLADLNGDGKVDIIRILKSGSLDIWYNYGNAPIVNVADHIHFADLFGKKSDDYVWIDPESKVPVIYKNGGPTYTLAKSEPVWKWSKVNMGSAPSGVASPASAVRFGDLNGDGKDDYFLVDPGTGNIMVGLNHANKDADPDWIFDDLQFIMPGLGKGYIVRIADIDGDGKDDIIYLNSTGGATIYQNTYSKWTKKPSVKEMPQASHPGINHRPEDITFVDMDHDGKADYVWTNLFNGQVHVWLNNYPHRSNWIYQGVLYKGPVSGASIKYGKMLTDRYYDVIIFDPENGRIAPWLYWCYGTKTWDRGYKWWWW